MSQQGIKQVQGASNLFEFEWSGKGRPHLVAEPGFQAVCPRNSRFIWRHVKGEIACTGGSVDADAQINGSEFPSHRIFVNGTVEGNDPQGDFGLLWQEDSSDLALVC